MEENTLLTLFSANSHYQISLQLGDRYIQKISAALVKNIQSFLY